MKNYAQPILFAGIAVIIIPFLGFPLHVRKLLLVITGVFIVLVSLLIYQRYQHAHKAERFRSYTENGNPKKITVDDTLVKHQSSDHRADNDSDE